MELVLTTAAVADVRATRAYYETAEQGLSGRFLVALDELSSRLQAFPRSAPPVAGYADVRRAVVRGSPFVVFCRNEPDRLVVLRVLPASRPDASAE